MATLMVLFNLKPGVDAGVYETWAKQNDLPNVRALKSVPYFEVVRVQSLLGSDASPPYQYVEAIEVSDMDVFGKELTTELMQKTAAQFQEFTDNPIFMLCNSIESDK
jgi:REDY-like protein HapK